MRSRQCRPLPPRFPFSSPVLVLSTLVLAIPNGSSASGASAAGGPATGSSAAAAVPVVSSPDSLWQRAIAVAATGDSTVPGSVDYRVEQLDSDGNVEKGRETWIRLSMGRDGKVEVKTVRVVEYHKDRSDSAQVPIEEKNNPDEKEKRQQVSMTIGESPFQSGAGVEIEARPNGGRKSIEGRTCIGYDFSRKEKKETMRGVAWIADSTGAPIEIQFTKDPLPRHVKRMMTTTRYVCGDSLGWRMKEMSIEAVGGFLFIKKRFHVMTTFAEYWSLPRARLLAQRTPDVSPRIDVPPQIGEDPPRSVGADSTRTERTPGVAPDSTESKPPLAPADSSRK